MGRAAETGPLQELSVAGQPLQHDVRTPLLLIANQPRPLAGPFQPSWRYTVPKRDVVSDRCAAAHATIRTDCRAAKVLVRLV